MKFIKLSAEVTIYTLIVVACSKPLAGDNQLSKKEIKEGWELLFDGQTMNGWRRIYTDFLPESGWRVEKGCLIMEYFDGKESANGGDLITIKEYSNFDFSFDFKMTTGANSGIKYFVNESIGDPNSGYGFGPEYQVCDDERVRGTQLKGVKLAGLYELIDAPDTKETKPIGEWNSGRIVSKDNHLEHWLNGKLMLSYVLGSDQFKELVQQSKFKNIEGYAAQAKGHILIQDHGSVVMFKNIKLKEL